MADESYRYCLQQAIAVISSEAGFSSMSSMALETVTEMIQSGKYCTAILAIISIMLSSVLLFPNDAITFYHHNLKFKWMTINNTTQQYKKTI